MATALAVAFVVFSCKGNLSEAEKLDLTQTPLQVVDSMFFVQTENGKLKMRVEAPVMEVYDHDTVSYELFPKGLSVYGYAEDGSLETTIKSQKARHDTRKKEGEDKWSAFGEGYLALHPENVVVFTGGDANYFVKRMKSSIFVICNLVLMGLALMADEYVKKNDQ